MLRISSLFLCVLFLAQIGSRTAANINIGNEPEPKVEQNRTFPASTDTEEWFQWRGPHANGTISNGTFSPERPQTGWISDWSRQCGDGYSSLTIRNGRLYTAGRSEDGKVEKLYCLNADNGREIWCSEIAVEETFPYAGPKSTPVTDSRNVYFISPGGTISAFRSRNGRIEWTADLQEICGTTPPQWGLSGSPVIIDGIILINANQYGIALDAENGNVLWQSPAGACGYATPVLLGEGNGETAVFFGQDTLYLVNIRSGRLISRYAWETKYDVNASDPLLVDDNRIFLSSSYGSGGVLLDCSNGHFEKVWETDEMGSHFSSMVQHQGYLYGIDGQTEIITRCYLKCLDAETGEVLWSHKMKAYGSLILIDGYLAVLDEHGNLFTAEASPAGFETIGEQRIFESRRKNWIAPVYSGGNLYLKSNTGELISLPMGRR